MFTFDDDIESFVEVIELVGQLLLNFLLLLRIGAIRRAMVVYAHSTRLLFSLFH